MRISSFFLVGVGHLVRSIPRKFATADFPRDLSSENSWPPTRGGLGSSASNSACGIAPHRSTRAERNDSIIMTNQTFADLGVAEPICRALGDEGYTHPTPIQKGAIPTLLEGRDLLGLAQTGTGKTAAFAAPILQRLSAEARPAANPRAPRALILAPTRELAVQINDSMKLYGRHLKLRSTAVFGGVGIGGQIDILRRGVDILVATPGRLLDLCDQRACDLGAIEILTLDEADRMLDMGFVRDVRRIVKMVPKVRQTLLFSATMPTDIESLASEILNNPAKVEVAHAGKTVDRIAQSVHFVPATLKRDLLSTLLADTAMSRVMVFTRTKRGADRVTQHLNRCAISAEAIHGNKSQNHRQRTLDGFRSGRTRVLVATDIAARGLDIDLVTHVFNFELPHEPEAYVHRIGRTARAGTEGTAIAFCSPDERADLKAIERLTRQTLAVAETPEIVRTAATEASVRDERNDERFEARAKLRTARGGERGGNRGGGRGRDGEARDGRGRSGPPRHREPGDTSAPAVTHARTNASSYDPTKPRPEQPGRSHAPRGEGRSEGRAEVRPANASDRPVRDHAPRGDARGERRGEGRSASASDRPARSHAPRGEARSEGRSASASDRPARSHAPRGEARSEHSSGEARKASRPHGGGRPSDQSRPRNGKPGSPSTSRNAKPAPGSSAGRNGGDNKPKRRTGDANSPSPWSNWTSRESSGNS